MGKRSGFSLIELSVVLTIVVLMLGGLLAGMTAYNDSRRYVQVNADLAHYRSLLVIYAAATGKFPCPSTELDPAMPLYGLPASSCPNPMLEGFFPWKLFGVPATDVWGNPFRYRLDRNFAVSGTPKTSFVGGDHLRVKNSAGLFLVVPDSVIAVVFSAGKNGVPDGENASYDCQLKPVPICIDGIYQADSISQGFDDLLIWVTPYDLSAYLAKIL